MKIIKSLYTNNNRTILENPPHVHAYAMQRVLKYMSNKNIKHLLLLGSQVSILEIYLPRNCLPRPQRSDIIAVGILVFGNTSQLKLF
jgi:hypothetical protein